MDELLQWIYGKSARNAHIREMAKKAIEIMIQMLEEKGMCDKKIFSGNLFHTGNS